MPLDTGRKRMTSIMTERPKKQRERASVTAFARGRQAFADGLLDSQNPYPEGRNTSERRSWYDGFYSARTESRVGHILEKYQE